MPYSVLTASSINFLFALEEHVPYINLEWLSVAHWIDAEASVLAKLTLQLQGKRLRKRVYKDKQSQIGNTFIAVLTTTSMAIIKPISH